MAVIISPRPIQPAEVVDAWPPITLPRHPAVSGKVVTPLAIKTKSKETTAKDRQGAVLDQAQARHVDQPLPQLQQALVLHGLRQRYVLSETHPVPELHASNETLIKTLAIGLNPIDWKSVDYGYGIPELPYLAGRDLAGVVVQAPVGQNRIGAGDLVLTASTDYRDKRKATYQEYAVALEHNVCLLPQHVSISQGAVLGVAFVAAALALGVCLGLKLPAVGRKEAVDLRALINRLPPSTLPEDVRAECAQSLDPVDRPRHGDWIVIWGGSSTSALFLSQLARLAGLRVILVVDVAKHGARLNSLGWKYLVDSHDPARAQDIIRGITEESLVWGIDTVGKNTAETLSACLGLQQRKGHLVGLAASPKVPKPDVHCHAVPVKLFHEVPEVGQALMIWLQEALHCSALDLPDLVFATGGLSGVNNALDQMRKGAVSGRRMVVPL